MRGAGGGRDWGEREGVGGDFGAIGGRGRRTR